jgi:hypothetical protein
MKPVFQILSIVDSFLLLLVLGLVWAFPHSGTPLVAAGLLAGLNAVFQSVVLEPMAYQARVALRVGGFVVAVVMAVSLFFVR